MAASAALGQARHESMGGQMIACYTNVLSARPGDEVALYISSSVAKTCEVEVARVGRLREPVLHQGAVAVVEQPVPADADRDGCGWTETTRFIVGADWRSGYYDIVVSAADGESTRHMLCVKPPERRSRALLMLATNTYQAYNWWGGRNAYCDAGAVMDGRMTMDEALEHPLGVLSLLRPFPAGLLDPGPAAPRTVNARPRGFRELPEMPSRAYRTAKGFGPLDLSAGFLNKWENVFVDWAEEMGLALDYATDRDVDEEPDLLNGYATVLVVGHSEYWSGGQRRALDAFVDAGGNLAVLSGNTSYWKVRWDGDQMACHKSRGAEVEAALGEEATGWWSHPMFNAPEAALLGLSFLFGGYHRLGMCVARGAGGYTIQDDAHWALAGTDLFYGDLLAPDLPLLGYENDGCLLRYDEAGRLAAVPHLGVPAELEVIATAPVAYAEDPARAYAPILAREKVDQVAEFVFGSASAANVRRMLHGHAVMASFRRGLGQVFHAGTTEWAHALGARDPFVTRITTNVLRRFGAL